jgi:CheY-like chemotaxis protein
MSRGGACRVREVSTAAAALDYVTAFTPDVVVIEGTLSDATAADLTRDIRRRPPVKDVPVVRLDSETFGRTPDDAGDWDVRLTVPCLPDHLLTMMQQAVERRRPITEGTSTVIVGEADVMVTVRQSGLAESDDPHS